MMQLYFDLLLYIAETERPCQYHNRLHRDSLTTAKSKRKGKYFLIDHWNVCSDLLLRCLEEFIQFKNSTTKSSTKVNIIYHCCPGSMFFLPASLSLFMTVAPIDKITKSHPFSGPK